MTPSRNGDGPGAPPFASVLRATFPDDAWWNNEVARTVGDATLCLCARVEDADLGKRALDTISKAVLDADPDVAPRQFLEVNDRNAEALFVHGSGLVLLAISKFDEFRLIVWGSHRETAERLREKVVAAIPRSKPIAREDLVPFAFWRTQDSDVDYHTKNIVCPSFDEIAGNYVPSLRAKLEQLMKHATPDAHGKIILWFGPPGTGKTHAVRALAREWVRRLHATAEVVLDPEAMFGSADRLHSIVLNEETSQGAVNVLRHRAGHRHSPTEEAHGVVSKTEESPLPLRLIILEDAAELFSSGCRSSQGFARFLNVTDGIVGQGLRCIFLLTANEEIGRIDEALTRPGRCLQALEFEPFDESSARDWLARHGCDPARARASATLAELFALRDSKEVPVSAQARVGF